MCISKKITEKLIAKGIIEERKYGADVYEYGIELILGDLINYILIFVTGIVLKQDAYIPLLYLICFVSVRIFFGGFHAVTHAGCSIFMNEGSTIRIYKSGDTITAVLDENNDTAEEVDISNKELDDYIESIKDNERKDLMKDYFFLPSVPQYRIQEISDLTLMERAKYLAEMPVEDLRAAVEVIRDHVDDSIRIQNENQNKG